MSDKVDPGAFDEAEQVLSRLEGIERSLAELIGRVESIEATLGAIQDSLLGKNIRFGRPKSG